MLTAPNPVEATKTLAREAPRAPHCRRELLLGSARLRARASNVGASAGGGAMSGVVLGRARAGRDAGGRRCPVLVVAAHPDDETLGAAALLLRSPGAAVVHLTDGAPRDRSFWSAPIDGSRAEYAAVRRDELERAAAIAGMAPGQLHALGAADQEAAHGLVELSFGLARTIAALNPKRLVTHPYEGGHPDHDAAAFVARAALALLRGSGRRAPPLFEMTSYHAGPDGSLRPAEFLAAAGPVHTRRLAAVERRAKDAMLAAFESQRSVIAWFPRDVERLRRAPPCDFARAPHEGPLWYERMGFPLAGPRWRELAGRAAARLERARFPARDAGPGPRPDRERAPPEVPP
jgi:LmbE family N-acetylglucosaminyl deacetylase